MFDRQMNEHIDDYWVPEELGHIKTTLSHYLSEKEW